MLIPWGLFAQHIGLVEALGDICISQRTRNYTPQTKLIEFLISILAGTAGRPAPTAIVTKLYFVAEINCLAYVFVLLLSKPHMLCRVKREDCPRPALQLRVGSRNPITKRDYWTVPKTDALFSQHMREARQRLYSHRFLGLLCYNDTQEWQGWTE